MAHREFQAVTIVKSEIDGDDKFNVVAFTVGGGSCTPSHVYGTLNECLYWIAENYGEKKNDRT